MTDAPKPTICVRQDCPPCEADPDVRRIPPSRPRVTHVALRAVR